jgi:hypothetical protein
MTGRQCGVRRGERKQPLMVAQEKSKEKIIKQKKVHDFTLNRMNREEEVG